MTIGANSYGSAAGVAVLVPRYANTSGAFDGTTRPTLAQVEAEIDMVSALVNSMLATNGFSVPVTQADVLLALGYFVNMETAAIVEGINGSGRFGPTTKSDGGKGRFALLVDDVKEFIEANAIGWERMGATRPYSATAGLGFMETDAAGNDVFPIFQRNAFGNEFEDWGGG